MTSDGRIRVPIGGSVRHKETKSCIMSCACLTSAVKRPYVCVEYGEQKRVSKVAAGKGKKSIWDQKFEFEIDYSPEEKKSSQKLVFRVMDKHKLSDDEYIGEARIYVKDVISSGMEEGEAELESRKYRVVREDQTYTGDVSVAVTFKRKEGGIKASLVNHEEITKFPISYAHDEGDLGIVWTLGSTREEGEVFSDNNGEEVLNDEGRFKEKCVNVDGKGNDVEPVLNVEDIEGVFGIDVYKENNVSQSTNDKLTTQKSFSYASMVKRDENPNSLEFIPTVVSETGIEIVIFDEEIVKKEVKDGV
ncbi:elicitor-responsive protein 1-like protein [Tanacetum coccineum]